MEHGKDVFGDRSGVFFVGNAVSFSDSILRAAENEFPALGFRRVNSIDDVRQQSGKTLSNTLAVILDETVVDDFSKLVFELHTFLPNAVVALAYRRIDVARKLLSEQMGDPSLEIASFLPMNAHFDSWLSALRLILVGDGYISRELWMEAPESAPAELAGNSGTGPTLIDGARQNNLTERELQVLSLVAEGKQNKTIAHELGLSMHTVKLHVHHVISKLDVTNRTEAAAWYFEHTNQARWPHAE
ncbi:MAG: response regulator transcription factor [Pseudomonadota bacterium]